MNFEYIREFNKGVERPKGVPSDWVVNPINNIDISFITSANKDKIYREQKIKFLEDRIATLEKSVESLTKVVGELREI